MPGIPTLYQDDTNMVSSAKMVNLQTFYLLPFPISLSIFFVFFSDSQLLAWLLRSPFPLWFYPLNAIMQRHGAGELFSSQFFSPQGLLIAWKRPFWSFGEIHIFLLVGQGNVKVSSTNLAKLQNLLSFPSKTYSFSLFKTFLNSQEDFILLFLKGMDASNRQDNLGNACLTSFFVTGAWDHNKLRQSLKAYQNAEKDETMKSNPDLYFNCATANKYLENYERALHGFESAALKDPSLNAHEEVQKIINLLDKIESSMKGQVRAKRLASLVSSLGEVKLKMHRKATINILVEGLNKAVAMVGKVLIFIKHDNIAPLYYLACDLDQTFFILSVYGLHSDAIKEGDRVTLLEPYKRLIDFSWNGKHYQFKSIRVDFMEQILVNEKAPAPHHAVRAYIHAQHKP
uniref:Tetratricopeptide repeat protein 5 isoform X3 n=1 Tax=Elaeis guineensis var. tenera TaxID=51953 RepID=A0A8N4IEX7_ELAGV|nr:tetratricopeptide repeat protein 5 isoform X3 [Elaeis guineensis]